MNNQTDFTVKARSRQLAEGSSARIFASIIVTEDSSPAGGPPFVKAVNVGVLEDIADPHIDPFARTRFTQAPRELGDEPLPLLHFGQVGHGISPVIYRADAQPRLAIHLARRSRLASGRFRRSPNSGR